MTNKIFKETHYSTDDDSRELIVDHFDEEATIRIGMETVHVGGTVQQLTAWRDMFQAAINDA